MQRPNILYILLLIVRFCLAAPNNIRDESTPSISIDEAISIGDCIVDNNTYTNGDNVPSLGPCEECHCQDAEVVCSMIKCKPNNSGCKIIQQTNHCCPQYKCECEFNGRIYNNGERLERPDDPCWVCYCKGGEVMCTSITCYERNDCTPHFVPGQCCPKYDHCPIEIHHSSGNNGGNGNTSNFSGKREMQPWLLTVPVTNQTSSLVTPTNMETPSPINKYPQTIKIIEILPTQGPTLIQQNRVVGVSAIPFENSNSNNNNNNNVQLINTEIVNDSSPSSSEQDETVSLIVTDDASDIGVTTTDDLLDSSSPSPTLISSDEGISEEVVNSDIYGGNVNTENVTNEESIISKLDESTINDNDKEMMTTMNINTNNEDEELTTEASEQTVFLSKGIDRLSLHSNEDDESVNINVPFVRSVPALSDQNTASSEELLFTMSSGNNEADISSTVLPISLNDFLETSTKQTDDLVIPSSDKILLTSGESESSEDTSKNNLYDNIVSPTEFITVPEYIQSGQLKENIKQFEPSMRPQLNNFNTLTTNDDDLIIINDEINNENISAEVQPDSVSYTTMIPQKFASNLMEINTESNFIDSTEGSGYEVISGWTYEDSTGETNQEQTVQPTSSESSSSSSSSSSSEEVTEENYDTSSHTPPTGMLLTTEGLADIDPMVNTPGIPIEFDQRQSTEGTTEKNTSNENMSTISEEDLNNFRENFQKSTTMSFPSILKLNDHIKFLKIEGKEQNQPNETKESTPIAKIGIYNPKKPNDMANLVTVITENNDNLSQDKQQQLFTENSMENSRENYTPHILLTPNDLKTLAEILIHEKIIPPYYQNEERSTNSLEQRSINGEFSTSESQSNEEKVETENNTESVEFDESSEEGVINNTTDINNLVEFINVTLNNQELIENATTTQRIPVNLTDAEKWAQNVLDKVYENILLPLEGINLVDRNNVTVNNETGSPTTQIWSTEEGEENTTPAQIVREDLFEISNETENDSSIENNDNSNNSEIELTTIENSEENQTETSSEVTTESNKSMQDDNQEEEESSSSQDINTSRQIRLPHRDTVVSHLLSTPLLDDKDLLLLHNFFKKNLNNK